MKDISKVLIIPPLSFGWYQSSPSKPRRGWPWLAPRPPPRAGPCPPSSAAPSPRPWERREGALESWRTRRCGGGRWGGHPRTGLQAPRQRRHLPPQCSWSERFWGEISKVLVTALVIVVRLRLSSDEQYQGSFAMFLNVTMNRVFLSCQWCSWGQSLHRPLQKGWSAPGTCIVLIITPVTKYSNWDQRLGRKTYKVLKSGADKERTQTSLNDIKNNLIKENLLLKMVSNVTSATCSQPK